MVNNKRANLFVVSLLAEVSYDKRRRKVKSERDLCRPSSAYVVVFCLFVFACFVVRDLCRSGCRHNYYLTPPPPSPYFSLPTIPCLTQVTVIWNQCAPKDGFGAV